MKRIKTWKRWSFLAGDVGKKKEPLCAYSQKGRVDRMGCYIVMTESDHRKVMAVYNAVMKYHELAKKDDDIATMLQYAEVDRACTRAEK